MVGLTLFNIAPAVAASVSGTDDAQLKTETKLARTKQSNLDKSNKTKGLKSTPVATNIVSATTATPATTYTITFDPEDIAGGVTPGTTLSTQYYATTGASFSPNAFSGSNTLPSGSGTWATNTGTTVTRFDASIKGLVSGAGPASDRRLLHAFIADWAAENGDPSIQVNFAIPVSTFSATFAGISNGAAGTATRVIAYDAAGNALATTTATPRVFISQQNLAVSSATPIASVKLVPGSFNDWVGIDNLTFTTATPTQIDSSVSFVPTSQAPATATCEGTASDYVMTGTLTNNSANPIVNPSLKFNELGYTGAPTVSPIRALTADGATCSAGGTVNSNQAVGTGNPFVLAPGESTTVTIRLSMPELRRFRMLFHVFGIGGTPSI